VAQRHREDNEKVAAARWTNVVEFCDWVAGRCGGQIEDEAGVQTETERKTLLEVVQTIALLSTLSEREKDQNVVTLSTLHASKGLEWPHVMLVGVNEGLLPFKMDEESNRDASAESLAQRLQESSPSAPPTRPRRKPRKHHEPVPLAQGSRQGRVYRHHAAGLVGGNTLTRCHRPEPAHPAGSRLRRTG